VKKDVVHPCRASGRNTCMQEGVQAGGWIVAGKGTGGAGRKRGKSTGGLGDVKVS